MWVVMHSLNAAERDHDELQPLFDCVMCTNDDGMAKTTHRASEFCSYAEFFLSSEHPPRRNLPTTPHPSPF